MERLKKTASFVGRLGLGVAISAAGITAVFSVPTWVLGVAVVTALVLARDDESQ